MAKLIFAIPSENLGRENVLNHTVRSSPAPKVYKTSRPRLSLKPRLRHFVYPSLILQGVKVAEFGV